MLIAICFLSLSTYAQQPVKTYTLTCITNAGVVEAADTASGTDTIYAKAIVNASSKADSGAVMLYSDVMYDWSVVPSITATTAGTVTFWGSNTGGNIRNIGSTTNTNDWVPLVSNTTQYNGSSSISISGTTRIYGHFILPNCQFKYIVGRYVSSGVGQTSTISGTMQSRVHSSD